MLAEYYHLHITVRGSAFDAEMKLDLSKADLVRRYVAPYLQGEAIRINGRRIQPDDVERIQIVLTDEPSEHLLPKVLADREAERSRGVIHFGAPGWGITRYGHAVTDDLIEEVEESLDSDSSLAGSSESHIKVPDSWDELLSEMAKAVRAFTKGRQPFLLARTFGGDSLVHPGFEGGELAIYFGDFAELEQRGYVRFLGGDSWDVTPAGLEYHENPNMSEDNSIGASAGTSGPQVFLVHGRDERRHEIARAVARVWGREPIILEERGGIGRTIIENFEHESSGVTYAIVLLTGDDEGRLRGDTELRPRARQNAVLELGYFLAKLGRNRVAILIEQDVEHPSDISGLRYIPLDTSGGWKLNLAKAMREGGLEVDLNHI